MTTYEQENGNTNRGEKNEVSSKEAVGTMFGKNFPQTEQLSFETQPCDERNLHLRFLRNKQNKHVKKVRRGALGSRDDL